MSRVRCVAWSCVGASRVAVSRVAVGLVTLALSVALTGCGATVKPWERAKLAHPTMRPESWVGVAEGHLHEVQEGASGGADSEGGGCGCN